MRHGGEYRCMIDRSCVSPWAGAVPQHGRVQMMRRGSLLPPSFYKEKGGRGLLAREVIRLTIVVYTPRRHDYHANVWQGESLYVAFLSPSRANARVRDAVQDDAPLTWFVVSRQTSRFLNIL